MRATARAAALLMRKPACPHAPSLTHRHGRIIAGRCMVAAASAVMSLASAQYLYNPAAADEAPGIRYFGSAKDDKGALLPGVSILLTSQQLSFLLVTDAQGRFRVNLPLDMRPESVTPKCFKVGYQLLQMRKRPGPKAAKVTVQVDCVLRVAQVK